jgi:hypothetical protein
MDKDNKNIGTKLFQMKIGEVVEIENNELDAVCVPGGWLFRTWQFTFDGGDWLNKISHVSFVPKVGSITSHL